MLCCSVLSCSVLCCAVLCCAVLCCAVLCCAVLCCAVLCCAMFCCVLLLLVDIMLCVDISGQEDFNRLVMDGSVLCDQDVLAAAKASAQELATREGAVHTHPHV